MLPKAGPSLKRSGSAEDAVRLFRLLAFTGQRFRHLFDQRLREEGYTSQQGFLLTIVRERGRPTLGEVASVISTTHQNAKQIAMALEREGMLRITRDGTDGRVRRFEPTAAGAGGWKSRNDEDFAAIGVWFSALSRSDQKTLADLLAKLAVWCCQTNANRSQFSQVGQILGDAQTTPLIKCGAAVGFENVPAGEVTFLIEMVVKGRVNSGKLLQTSHLPEALHGSFPSSEWQMRILSPVVYPPPIVPMSG